MSNIDMEHFKNYWNEQQKTAKHMDEAAVKEHIWSYIDKHEACALATGTGDFVRCTPMEYIFMDGCFYIYSEGGQKFISLEKNTNVSLCLFDYHGDRDDSHGLQVTGKAELFPPRCELFKEVLAFKGIPYDVVKSFAADVVLIKITPSEFEMYDTDFVKQGYDIRQFYRP